MPGSFIDTNVLAYVASDDPVKANRAEAVIANGGTISVQVLNELANVARRKMHLSLTDTRALVSGFRALLSVEPLTVEMHETGLALAERYGFSTYDAMIVAAAMHTGCDVIYSEDFQHGMSLDDGLRIVNPFHSG